MIFILSVNLQKKTLINSSPHVRRILSRGRPLPQQSTRHCGGQMIIFYQFIIVIIVIRLIIVIFFQLLMDNAQVEGVAGITVEAKFETLL